MIGIGSDTVLVVMPKAQLLFTDAKLNLGDRASGEIERDSFITLRVKRGTQEANALKTEPVSLVNRESLYSQAGECDKDKGSNTLASLLSSAQFQKGGVADKIRVSAGP